MELLRKWSFGLVGRQLPDKLDYLLKPKPETVEHALQTSAAAVLALLAAFYFQLESPYWAPTTALIVSNSVHGQVISKGIFRLLGTVIGAIVAILMMSCFAQASDVFVLCFALWIGICTCVGSLLRNFRMYAAALAGYTAAIIVVSSISQPGIVLDVALARVAAISCGICSSMLISSLFSKGSSVSILHSRIDQTIRDVALLLQDAAHHEEESLSEKFSLRCYNLIKQITALGAMVDFAAVESAEVKKRTSDLHHLIANLMQAQTAVWMLAKSLVALRVAADDGRIQELLQEAEVLGRRMSGTLDTSELSRLLVDIGFFAKRYRALIEQITRGGGLDSYRPLIVVRNLGNALDKLSLVLESWEAYREGRSTVREQKISYDLNIRLALINGFRSFCGVLLAGIFWIKSAWPDGSSMLMMVGIGCSLFSSSLKPTTMGISFLVGGIISMLVAVFCYLLVLPYIGGFPLLAAMIGVVIFLGLLHEDAAKPEMSTVFSASCTNFFMFMRFTNPMTFDFQTFLNRNWAQLLGMLCATMAFVLIFPVWPRREIRRAIRHLLQSVRILAKDNKTSPRSVWESGMYDSLVRVMGFLEIQREATRELVDDYFAMIEIGNQLIALKHLAQADRMPPELVELINRAVSRVGDIGIEDEGMADEIRELAKQAYGRDANDERETLTNQAVAASLFEIAYLLRTHKESLTQTEATG